MVCINCTSDDYKNNPRYGYWGIISINDYGILNACQKELVRQYVDELRLEWRNNIIRFSDESNKKALESKVVIGEVA